MNTVVVRSRQSV